jgi:DNA-binding SARP family transcriptional activator
MGSPGVHELRFSVLGPVRVWRGETVVDLGPVQQRVVLAVLALQAGRSVGRGQLIKGVWGEGPPRNAVNLVQRHVSGLRRVLEPERPGRAPSGVLTWTDVGYLLRVPAGGLDLGIYEGEVARARAARAAGLPAEAAAVLRGALGLWRGAVCEGLSSPFVDAQRERLAESRIGVLEERIELELAAGDHGDLVGELRGLLAEYPLRERLHGLLMVALYRAGRRGDALAAYRGARRLLREELGVEPAAPLQRLHQQILAADPALAETQPAAGPPATGPGTAGPPGAEVAAGSGEAPGAKRPLPAQLPHRIPEFTGREAELGQLDALLAEGGGGAQGGGGTQGDGGAEASVVIAAIAGTAGVGKTALAVHWAHRVRGRFPDGQLHVNLRGFDPAGSPMEPAEAIRGFLEAFGVVPQQIPASLEAQAALYRSLLAGRRVLVLLDNACDEDQVRPLLPGSPGCLVIVTSRSQLPGLIVTEGARPVLVDLLSAAEARHLLARRLGQGRMAAEPQAAGDIIALCARLPLALMLVAARAATHPGFSLSALAGELGEAGGSLDAFEGEDQASNVRAVFSWSYQRLSVPGRRLFRLLGLHDGPDVATAAVASLAGMGRDQVRPLLAELARAHLVTERVPGRFAFHDLLRAYATETAHAHDPRDYRSAARHRMLDHYLHTAHHADKLIDPARGRPFTLPGAGPGVTPERLADSRQALAWFESEHAVLLAVLRHATGFDTHIWPLAWVVASYFEYQGHWRDWRDSQIIALDAGRRLSDKPAQAHSHRSLGTVSIRLGEYDQAQAHLRLALDLFDELGDNAGRADVHRNLAWVLEQRGRYRDMLSHAEQALALSRATGQRSGEASALNAVGWFHAQLGDYQLALARCREALDLARETGDRFVEAATHDSLGFAHRHLGHQRRATACYQQAADLYRELGDRYNEADTLVSLGDAKQAFGDHGSARDTWRRALAILDQLGHPHADRVRARISELNEYVAPRPRVTHGGGVPVDAWPPPVQRPRRRHRLGRTITDS